MVDNLYLTAVTEKKWTTCPFRSRPCLLFWRATDGSWPNLGTGREIPFLSYSKFE